MPPRRYLGLGLVLALVAAVAVALATSGDGVDEPFADVPTDVEAATPTSVISVPEDEGIDHALVLIADLESEQTVPSRAGEFPGAVGRFEAVSETADELCFDLLVSGVPDQLGEVAVRVGTAGDEGELALSLGDLTAPSSPVGAARVWHDMCIPIAAEIRASLETSTDAYYVEVYAAGDDEGVLRGQLHSSTLFDLQLDEDT